jgi:hypothetical protein
MFDVMDLDDATFRVAGEVWEYPGYSDRKLCEGQNSKQPMLYRRE